MRFFTKTKRFCESSYILDLLHVFKFKVPFTRRKIVAKYIVIIIIFNVLLIWIINTILKQ